MNTYDTDRDQAGERDQDDFIPDWEEGDDPIDEEVVYDEWDKYLELDFDMENLEVESHRRIPFIEDGEEL